MRIIFIRHGDPDYENDTLTEKGWREAALLAKRVSGWDVTEFYCSPLGRAQDTASCSLKATGRTAITLPWMQEFAYQVTDPTTGLYKVPWDFMPQYWTTVSDFYDKDHWMDAPLYSENHELKPAALEAFSGFDKLLSTYGYERTGNYYRVTEHSDDTIVVFCHLGAELLIVGHLCGIAPSVLWHSVFLAPTSVTVLNSEERLGDTAYFRIQMLGDTRHLHDGGEPVSMAGAFAEPFQG